jgi:hypothetical protein
MPYVSGRRVVELGVLTKGLDDGYTALIRIRGIIEDLSRLVANRMRGVSAIGNRSRWQA